MENKIKEINEINYLEQLTDVEQIAFHIVKTHLDTSFHLFRSNGFVEWEKGKKEEFKKREANLELQETNGIEKIEIKIEETSKKMN